MDAYLVHVGYTSRTVDAEAGIQPLLLCHFCSIKGAQIVQHSAPVVTSAIRAIFCDTIAAGVTLVGPNRAETDSRPHVDYMRAQSDLNEGMRAILIEWLVDVHLHLELAPETLYLTVSVIDRFLSADSAEEADVARSKLQPRIFRGGEAAYQSAHHYRRRMDRTKRIRVDLQSQFKFSTAAQT